MNDNAKKWVEALRGEGYKQGRGALAYKDNNVVSYCCLGVACDLYQSENGDLDIDSSSRGDNYRIYLSFDGETGVLPLKVANWLGMQTRDGGISASETLAHLNDSGSAFSAIADRIEQEEDVLLVAND